MRLIFQALYTHCVLLTYYYNYIHAHRVGPRSLLLRLYPDSDPRRLAGREGRGQVGVWSGCGHDITVYSLDSPGCPHQRLATGGRQDLGRLL